MKTARVIRFAGFAMGMALAHLAGAAPRSNHLVHFDLTQCNSEGCFRATADSAFASQDGQSFSARDVVLEISPVRKEKRQHLRCDYFRYDLSAQDLTCDNRDRPNAVTLTIDREFRIRRY